MSSKRGSPIRPKAAYIEDYDESDVPGEIRTNLPGRQPESNVRDTPAPTGRLEGDQKKMPEPPVSKSQETAKPIASPGIVLSVRPEPTEKMAKPMIAPRLHQEATPETQAHEKLQIKKNAPEYLVTTTPRDITQHFELDIGVDIVDELEEVCRLKRLGHFREAEEHIRTSLGEFLTLSLIKLEYADLLLEQGNYRRFHELSVDGTISTSRFLSANYAGGSPTSTSLLSQDLMRLRSLFAIDGSFNYDVEGCLDVVSQHFSQHNYNMETELDSVAVITLRDWLKAIACVQTEAGIISTGAWNPITLSWTGLYQHILHEDRVWDFRDLILAMADATSPSKAWKYLTDTKLSLPGKLRCIYDQWAPDEYAYDESTNLAFLEMFSHLATLLVYRLPHYQPRDHSKEGARQCLQEARNIALIIQKNSPDLIRSRPYLRYILANAQYERFISGERSSMSLYRAQAWHEHFSKFPGLAICYDGCPPIYLPTHAENPGWCPAAPGSTAIEEQLQTAITVANEISDYELEALLLKELICRLSEPQEQINRLLVLQRSIQGHTLDYLKTLLTQYLLVKDDTARRALCTEIACYRPSNIYECAPLINFCATRVLTALHRALGDPPGLIGAVITRSLELQERLPASLRRAFTSPAGDFSVWGRGCIRHGGESITVLRRRLTPSEKEALRQRRAGPFTLTDSSADETDLTEQGASERFPQLRGRVREGHAHRHNRSMRMGPYQATVEDASESSGAHDGGIESEDW